MSVSKCASDITTAGRGAESKVKHNEGECVTSMSGRWTVSSAHFEREVRGKTKTLGDQPTTTAKAQLSSGHSIYVRPHETDDGKMDAHL